MSTPIVPGTVLTIARGKNLKSKGLRRGVNVTVKSVAAHGTGSVMDVTHGTLTLQFYFHSKAPSSVDSSALCHSDRIYFHVNT
jgi:hypothetical protein